MNDWRYDNDVEAGARERLRKTLQKYPWEWRADLCFPPEVSQKYMFKRTRRWLKAIQKEAKVKYGAILIYQADKEKHNPHVHCLMTSTPTPWGVRLPEVDISWANDQWPFYSSIQTKTNRSSEEMAEYVTREKNLNLHRPQFCTIDVYRSAVLESMFPNITLPSCCLN